MSTNHIKSQAEHAKALLARYKHDPLEQLINLADDMDLSIKDKIRINQILMKFAYPELKSVDVEQVVETKIVVNIAKFSSSCPPQQTEFVDTQVIKETKLIEQLPNSYITKEIANAWEKIEAEIGYEAPEAISTRETDFETEEKEEVESDAYKKALSLDRKPWSDIDLDDLMI